MTLTEPAQPTEAPAGAAMAADYIDVDLIAGATFERAVPHPAFDALRREAPVAWHTETPVPQAYRALGVPERPSPGFWVVTSHAGVSEVSRHPELFSSWLGGFYPYTPDPASLMALRQMLIGMDPPEHTRLRRILQPVFTPRAVQRLHELVERNAREIVDEVAAAGGCDFVTSVAAEMPIRVFGDMLGMPPEDRHLLFDWSNKMIGLEDPEYGGDVTMTMVAAAEMFQYGKQVADSRRAEPRDDLVSLIANAEIEGERLTDLEFGMFWLLLIVAGNETTRNSLSGGVIALSEHDRWGWLREHPEAMGTAAEEILRYVTPVMQFRRTATRDVELQGQSIRAGDKVIIWHIAANRDESVFANPHELDLARDPNPHLAFGVGQHFCLGAHLARLQLTALLGELLRRLPDLEIDGPVERTRSSFISGIRHLPVRYTAA